MGFPKLDHEQKLAADHIDGAALVMASPGSGKTTVIVDRCHKLVKKGRTLPERILLLSFNRQTCLDLKKRLQARDVNNTYFLNRIQVSTFHAFSFSVLSRCRNGRIEVLESKKQSVLLGDLLKFFGIASSSENIRNIISKLGCAKNCHPDGLEKVLQGDFCGHQLYEYFDKYEEMKRDIGCIDFDDMLIDCLAVLDKNSSLCANVVDRYDYIMVDEFQDVNYHQYCILKRIVGAKYNVFCVGDDDQTIYGFRGSSPRYINEYCDDFPNAKTYFIGNNYRSGKKIIELCNKVITNNTYRVNKQMKLPEKSEECQTRISSHQDAIREAEAIVQEIMVLKQSGVKSIAILFRVNSYCHQLISCLLSKMVPFIYEEQGESIFMHWIAEDVLAYLRLMLNQSDMDAFLRVANRPYRFIDKQSLRRAMSGKIDNVGFYDAVSPFLSASGEEMLDFMDSTIKKASGEIPARAINMIAKRLEYKKFLIDIARKHGVEAHNYISILDEIIQIADKFSSVSEFLDHMSALRKTSANTGKIENIDKVFCSTFHRSKGLEFDAVFLAGCNESIIPHQESVAACSREALEEERRLFYVGMSRAKNWLYISSIGKYRGISPDRSRFIDEMDTV